MKPEIVRAVLESHGGKSAGEPRYPFHKLMSGPTSASSDYELYVSGEVTEAALRNVAAAITQAADWLRDDQR